MLDTLAGLFDMTGFPPRKNCGPNWTPSLIWLHVTSDFFIWLAYVSIPMMLVYFTRRRDLPFPRLFVLFALFILACGCTHLIDALIFEYPIYRFAGVMKLITAVVSWATVIALVPVVPRVMFAVSEAMHPGADSGTPRPLSAVAVEQWRGYVAAIAAGIVSVLIRILIDPIIGDNLVFVVALLAVVYVSWQYGFGPGIACLLIGVFGYTYLFAAPRNSIVIEGLGDQLTMALCFFCGAACAALGESQRIAHRRANQALTTAMMRQDELESEIARRREIESALRQRERELVAAQQDSAESLARLNAFLDNAPLGISFFDSNLRYVRINPFLAEANGRSVADHIGRTLAEVVPDFPPDLLDVYRQVASADGTPYATQIRRADPRNPGVDRFWQVNAFPVKDAIGRSFGAGVVVQDITERRKAEEELRRSEQQFRVLAEVVPYIVWVARPEGHHDYFNRRWYTYTGLTGAESIGSGWIVPLHPDDLSHVESQWRASIASGADFEFECRIRRADGVYRWFLGRAVPERDAEGNVARWIGAYTDIDDQKRQAEILEEAVKARTTDLRTQVEDRMRAETEVRQQQKFLDAILSNVTDGIVACNEMGTLTLFNRAAREFHGQTSELLPPEQWAERYNLYRNDGVTPLPTEEIPLVRALRGELVRDVEIVIAPHQGPRRVVLANGQRLTDSDGRNLGAVVSMRDVTKQREADQQLAEAVAELGRTNVELKRSNGELEKFAYVASHDLQEPLRKIQAFGDRLLEKCRDQLNDQGREYLDRMLVAAGRMRRLINDLLTFSRVSTQRQPFRRVDLAKLAREVASDLDVLISQSQGTVRLGNLTAIDADPSQMRQLFQNLIANALKFRRPDVNPEVVVEGELIERPAEERSPDEPSMVLRISVRDNGIGFDEKYRDRIFEIFQRLHGRDHYEGSGVGLAICRKIAERHGGTISAFSREGQGATFVVEIPVHQPPSQEGNDSHA